LSSATDPYLQFEKEEKLTRKILEVILKYRFPVHVITRSDLVTRDFDLLHEINKNAILPIDLAQRTDQKVFITFSFSTVDDKVAKVFEPGATPPLIRLQTLEETARNNFHTGVSMMPMLPYISDTTESLNAMFTAFKNAGAKYVMPATITLFGNGIADSKTMVLRAVEKHYPHLFDKYKKIFSASHELPAYYNKAFFKKMQELGEHYQVKNRIL
jgi:DNA repair photolyase